MSMNYSTPDTSAWQKAADDLFLARFRGRPCEVCGKTNGTQQRKKKVISMRSCGHHIQEKDLHRIYRYDPRNIVTLCPLHHGRYTRSLSPHSGDTVAVAAFYEWLRTKKPEKWNFLVAHGRDEWTGGWTYKEKFVELGGTITDEKFKKDQRPLNLSATVRKLEGV